MFWRVLFLCLIASQSLNCTECPAAWLGDGLCDLPCMTSVCGFDYRPGAGFSALGDCYASCKSKGCADGQPQNGVCEAECNNAECGWDGGDCGLCAKGCKSHVGTLPMLANGVCNPECLTAACANDLGDCMAQACSPNCYAYMIGDGRCDKDCHYAACLWDKTDCDCAPGCTSDLLHNSGDCAPGCWVQMLGNAVCEASCYNAACQWDGLDCGCAADCRYSEYGSCKPQCLVPDCNYDQMPGFPQCADSLLRTAALYFHLAVGNFSLPYSPCGGTCSAEKWAATATDCVPECHKVACGLSLGHCNPVCDAKPAHCANCGLIESRGCFNCDSGALHFYATCVLACPPHFHVHALVNSLCYPNSDATQAASPAVFVVTSSANAGGTGTPDNPFPSISLALAACVFTHCRIELQPGTHYLSLLTPSSYLQTWVQYPDWQPYLSNTTRLTITAIECMNACVRPILLYDNLFPLQLTIHGHVAILNIALSGNTTLVRDCQTVKCTYCATISVAAGGTGTDDQGAQLLSGSFALPSACARFKYYSFIVLQADSSLFIANSTISGFRQGLGSLVTMKSGNLVLEDVLIANVSTSSSQSLSTVTLSVTNAVLQQNSSNSAIIGLAGTGYEAGTIQLLRVNVSHLNNGYELTTGLGQFGVLASNGIRSIVLKNCTFTLSVVQNGALISAVVFLTFLVDGCTFSYIYTETHLFRISSTGILALTPGPNGQPADYYLDHITIRNSTFSRVAAVPRAVGIFSGNLIYISIAGQMMNVLFDSVFFRNCFGSIAVVAIVRSATPGDSEKVGSSVRYASGTQRLTLLVPFMWVRLTGVTVDKTYLGANMFQFSRASNIEISQLDMRNSGDGQGVVTVTSQVISHIMNKPGVYITKGLSSGVLAACSAPVAFLSVYNTTIFSVVFRNNTCLKTTPSPGTTLAGQGGFVTTSASGNFNFSDADIAGVSGPSVGGGTLLHVSTSGPVYLSRLRIDGVSNTGGTATGILSFSATAAYGVFLYRCLLQRVVSLGPALWLNGAFTLTIEQSQFISNSVRGNAVISFLPGSNFTYSFIAITRSEFTQNVGGDGTVLYCSNVLLTPVPLTLTILASVFQNNTSTGAGAAVYIDNKSALTQNSSIAGCTFSGNLAKEASIFVAFLSGGLTISNCVFSSNSAQSTSAISASQQPSSPSAPTFLTISSSEFQGNSGSSLIKVANPSGFEQVYSQNNTFARNFMRVFDIDRTIFNDTSSRFEDNFGSAIRGTTLSQINCNSSVFRGGNSTIGGAIYLGGGSNMYCILCEFSKNTAETYGGAVFIEQASVVTALNSTFWRNRAGQRGSAAYLFGSSSNSTFRFSSFTENESGDSGTIVAISSSVRVQHSLFAGNTAQKTAGITAYFSYVVISDVAITNHTGLNSPFIYSALETNFVIKDSFFYGISTNSEGGIVYALSSTLTISNTQFAHLEAVSGVVLLATAGTVFSISNCEMRDIVSTDDYGGVIIANDGSGAITNSTLASYARGGVVATDLDSLRFDHVSFIGGAVQCTWCVEVVFLGCKFENLSANRGAAVYFTGHTRRFYSAVVPFTQCAFTGLKSQEGGVYLENVGAEFVQCSFTNCTARLPVGHGGALSLSCGSVPGGCSVLIQSCAFVNNTADDEGGSVKWYDSMPLVRNTSFEGGKAHYGPDFASFPVHIHTSAMGGNASLVSNSTEPYEGTLHYVASGQVTPHTLEVSLFDHYEQKVLTEGDFTAAVMESSSDADVLGTTSSKLVNGSFVFEGFGVIAKPESETFIKVVTTAIDFTRQAIARDNTTYSNSVVLRVEMRACVIGESLFQSQCAVCPSGKYSLNPASNCEDCPVNAICYGNYTMAPKAGYWRTSPYTDVFWKCPYESACVGSPEPPLALSLTGECQTGYFGNLCNACASGFSRMSQVECGRCPSLTVNIVRTGGIALALLVFLVFVVAAAIRSAYRSASHFSIFIKILLNYMQLVMLTASFDLRWPSYMMELFRSQQTVGNVTDQVFSIDCFFRSTGQEDQANAVRLKIVILSFLPILMTALGALFWLPYSAVKRKWSHLQNELVTTSVVFFFLIHPSLVKFMFDFLNCRELDPGEYWMSSFLNIRCWDYVHIRYALAVALPSIVVWGLGLPSLCLGYMVRSRNTLGLTHLRLRLGFIYNGYVSSKYYWELVILYRKILIISIAVFIANISVYVQALSAMLVIIFAFALQSKNAPYIVPAMNELELRAILVGGVTIYSGMYCMSGSLDSTSQMILFVLIVGLNAYFLAYWTARVLAASWLILKGRFAWLSHLCEKRDYRIQPRNVRSTRFSSVISEVKPQQSRTPDVSQFDEGDNHGSLMLVPENSMMQCEATSRRYKEDESGLRASPVLLKTCKST